MASIPKFKSLDEAAEFWDSHDLEDYLEDTEPVMMSVRIPRRQVTLKVPLDLKTYEQIEALAAQRGLPVAKLVSAWLKEKAKAESAK